MNWQEVIKEVADSSVVHKKDVLEFLMKEKAREMAVDPEMVEHPQAVKYYCPECEASVGLKYHYCCKCGQKLEWRFMK